MDAIHGCLPEQVGKPRRFEPCSITLGQFKLRQLTNGHVWLNRTDVAGARIGRRLRECREAAGWTQDDVAKLTKLKPTAVSHFECGRRTPHVENLRILCIALSVSADDLLGLSIHPTRS